MRGRRVVCLIALLGAGCGESATMAARADTGAAESGEASSGGPSSDDAAASGSTEPAVSTTVGGTSDATGDETGGETGDPSALRDEAGYFTIAPVGFTFDGSPYTSSEARMFFAFQPAQSDPNDKPLFVFFNGGPGAGSGILFGFNTASRTLDPSRTAGEQIVDNPWAWTEFANCLWIDARLTGFGYGITDDPADTAERIAEFAFRNFNPWLDGADFLRALLMFYDEHETLRDNPVVLVGESYGGVRAQTILDLALFTDEHAAGAQGYVDADLVARLDDHFAAALPDVSDAPTPDEAAQQFGRQILIQPLLAGDAQLSASGVLLDGPDTPLHDLAAELGTSYPSAPAFYTGAQRRQWAVDWVRDQARDPNNTGQPEGWTDDVITAVNSGLRTTATLELALGVDPTTLEPLFADSREHAYRVAQGPAPQYGGNLSDTFGELAAWDVYYLSFVRDVFDAFYGAAAFGHDVEPTSTSFGRVALRNLLRVETLVTHGTADVVVWPPALAPAFATFPEVEWSAAGDDKILVQYVDGAFGEPDAPYREIEFPRFEGGAHSIPMTHPEQIHAAVEAWLP